MPETGAFGLYGTPPSDLADMSAGAIQFSPLIPGARSLEDQPDGSLSEFVMLAPPGTVERRYAMAQGLRALAPGAPFTVLAPKDKGGARLAKELKAFGCAIEPYSKHHHKICSGYRPEALEGIAQAIEDGAPRFVEDLGLWSQPGIFSWNRTDPGSAALIGQLPPLEGRGADFGCGAGLLAKTILGSPKVTQVILLDIDRRAIEAARRNIDDPRARIEWADVRQPGSLATLCPTALDFIVMNPPFHDGGAEDRALGQAFIAAAAGTLRKGGSLWLTANRHLPYEAVLRDTFSRVTLKVEEHGFKVYEARK
ncbi:class I SAM-dependent methyltransferase [Breoghania sp. L-A4]|uniref:class I SAM-dependent methyltransferase n=1 Tax=Breoghania sp. L-A4 TaxID=2304600 RepID=UPI000E35FC64|nr:class I SAM-dependent methyltransferase [Breoghania sp. L-A4]AXS41297.1 class I SAM-dependent methyltransferase [Breoghania sp. L-A4]